MVNTKTKKKIYIGLVITKAVFIFLVIPIICIIAIANSIGEWIDAPRYKDVEYKYIEDIMRDDAVYLKEDFFKENSMLIPKYTEIAYGKDSNIGKYEAVCSYKPGILSYSFDTYNVNGMGFVLIEMEFKCYAKGVQVNGINFDTADVSNYLDCRYYRADDKYFIEYEGYIIVLEMDTEFDEGYSNSELLIEKNRLAKSVMENLYSVADET